MQGECYAHNTESRRRAPNPPRDTGSFYKRADTKSQRNPLIEIYRIEGLIRHRIRLIRRKEMFFLKEIIYGSENLY